MWILYLIRTLLQCRRYVYFLKSIWLIPKLKMVYKLRDKSSFAKIANCQYWGFNTTLTYGITISTSPDTYPMLVFVSAVVIGILTCMFACTSALPRLFHINPIYQPHFCLKGSPLFTTKNSICVLYLKFSLRHFVNIVFD